MTTVDTKTIGCRVVFGDPSVPQFYRRGTAFLHIRLPLLGGPIDDLILNGGSAEPVEGFTMFRSGSRIAGFWQADPAQDLETSARQAYATLLKIIGTHRLYRAWNFVPRINAVEGGLENYRRFCRGRSLAFESHFGAGFRQQLSAASAVGTNDRSLAVAFLAGTESPTHFENPVQVPAFNYPSQYGPRPPSFARATSLRARNGGEQIFISGTAAIRDHRTVGVGDLEAQLTYTLDNLRLIAAAAGAGRDVGAESGWRRMFRVYLRRETDWAATKARLERELLRPGDTTQYLRADICRADLLVEIESALVR